jgi:predicted dehydrogenase
MTVRYAVVGAGGYAGVHIDLIGRHGPELGCELAAVAIRPADRRSGQVEAFTARGVQVFADAQEMFAATLGRVEAVFIPTGIYTHAALVCAALAAGHNVYVEKPPAATVQEVDAMLEARRRSGRICALGFQAIYSHSINWIKQRVVAGRLGQVRRLRCWAFWPRDDGYYARNEWAGQLRFGEHWVLDGPASNALAHQTANMLYLASPKQRAFAAPLAVRAELYHARAISGEDTSALEIHTDSGAVAYFIASHCCKPPHTGPWIEMDCSAGQVSWHFSGKTRIRYADGSAEALDGDGRPAQHDALASFTAAVSAGDASLLRCDLNMGRCFTLAINGAYESSRMVRAIPPQLTSRGLDEKGRPITIVEGMNEAIARCGQEGRLFSDIGLPWASASQPFDLRDYRRFPVQFR